MKNMFEIKKEEKKKELSIHHGGCEISAKQGDFVFCLRTRNKQCIQHFVVSILLLQRVFLLKFVIFAAINEQKILFVIVFERDALCFAFFNYLCQRRKRNKERSENSSKIALSSDCTLELHNGHFGL